MVNDQHSAVGAVGVNVLADAGGVLELEFGTEDGGVVPTFASGVGFGLGFIKSEGLCHFGR